VLDNENIIIFADRYYDNGDIDLIFAKVNRKTGIIWITVSVMNQKTGYLM
jgi:hypothetical protein